MLGFWGVEGVHADGTTCVDIELPISMGNTYHFYAPFLWRDRYRC